jgi:hypothetical protein
MTAVGRPNMVVDQPSVVRSEEAYWRDEDAGLLTTALTAKRLAMSEAWVREHAAELGGIRIGDSKHTQLRFEPGKLEEWKERHRLKLPRTKTTHRPARRRAPSGVDLLPLPARR